MDFPGPHGALENDMCDEFDRIFLQTQEITPEWREYDRDAVMRW
jgi:hypothetical protein